ncbi:MAG: ABC transporter ATP-binding protein [Faecalicatena sp.]|uniref:ABC transporter ATP-binding protein n=1 Tax=Faecalicatena sp. TaxID=2005360 RepID=UPI00258A4720|nr:ABC transporter ATP-binding protein [Faecalicatena sp.]MCI6467603.1 ABC transporter ATP-binding protein [Faecalicatena sp.]MDY5619779.1 ABC transporter ATP-binding protein [Lachnospiraceae bacterium]
MILKATGLSKSFPIENMEPQHVLKNIQLTINKGEFVSVMGASGSGKSTLLYTISGMMQPSAGTVEFAGEQLNKLTEEQLTSIRLNKMGFVFQQANLLKNFNLKDNIILSAYLGKKESQNEIDKRAVQLMKQTGVHQLALKDITQASGGQLQRVSICRALINKPEIIFGDEPTGALNSKSASEIMMLFNEINQNGTTILLVTHDAKVASKTERILFMADGEIVSEKYLGKMKDESTLKEREKQVAKWLNGLNF